MFHSEFVSVFSFCRVWCTCRFVLPPGWSAGSSSHPGTVLAGSHLPAPADPQASDTPLRRLSSCRHLEKQKWNYQWKTTTITNHWWENAVTHLDVGILLEIFWTQVNKSVIVLVLVLMFTGGNITASYSTNRTFEHLAESGKQTLMWLMNKKHRAAVQEISTRRHFCVSS